ncbi:MAG: ABC transporter substrate-binding protein [Lachnospiraceae bacterium]|nr:ABC transporter substrate-binding protein [Lachnospiraceae bacterium]
MKKKALSILLAAAMAGALLTGCGGSSSSTSTEAEETAEEETAEEETEEAAEEEAAEETEGAVYNIAIVKQMDHASLDEIAEAIEAELDVIAEENGVTINYETYSGQGEQSVLTQIGTQVISEGVDAIIPIATLAAQVMVTCAEETQTPVIFAAISDPEGAELTDIDYLTGTSDALNTEFIMDMMFAQNADIQKVGLLYSLSEDNSTTPIAEAKAYLDAAGIEYVEKTANTNDEVITAASALIAEGVDTIFTPTDNVVMAAELAIYENLIEAGILHYTGADSFVRNGAFATCGVNYTELGYETADLAYEAIVNGMVDMEDYYLMDGGIITVNTETAEAIGADYSVFADMGELVEVITTED